MKEFFRQLLFFGMFLLLPIMCCFPAKTGGTPQWFDKLDSMEHLCSIHGEDMASIDGSYITHNGIRVEYILNPYPFYRFMIAKKDGFFKKKLGIKRIDCQTSEDSSGDGKDRATFAIVAVEDPKTWKDGSQAVLFSNGEVLRFDKGALLRLEETGSGHFQRGSKHYEPWTVE